MPLNKVEYQSAVWKKLKVHMERRLDKLRKDNDTVSPDSLLRVQGAIIELKLLIGLDNKGLEQEALEDDDFC